MILGFWIDQSATRTGPWGLEHVMKTEAMTIKAGLPAACVLTAGGYSIPAGCFSKDRISTKANNYKDSNQKDLLPKTKMKSANTLITADLSKPTLQLRMHTIWTKAHFPLDYHITSYTILLSPPFFLCHQFSFWLSL